MTSVKSLRDALFQPSLLWARTLMPVRHEDVTKAEDSHGMASQEPISMAITVRVDCRTLSRRPLKCFRS